jgi:hypothetical protein
MNTCLCMCACECYVCVGMYVCACVYICQQLDAYMATPQADILEHGRTHLLWLKHACVPWPSSYEKLMSETRSVNQCSQRLSFISWYLSYCSAIRTRCGQRITCAYSPIGLPEEHYRQKAVEVANHSCYFFTTSAQQVVDQKRKQSIKKGKRTSEVTGSEKEQSESVPTSNTK